MDVHSMGILVDLIDLLNLVDLHGLHSTGSNLINFNKIDY